MILTLKTSFLGDFPLPIADYRRVESIIYWERRVGEGSIAFSHHNIHHPTAFLKVRKIAANLMFSWIIDSFTMISVDVFQVFDTSWRYLCLKSHFNPLKKPRAAKWRLETHAWNQPVQRCYLWRSRKSSAGRLATPGLCQWTIDKWRFNGGLMVV
jgi:hypothetical protein